MPTSSRDHLILPRRLGDRVVLFVFSSMVGGFLWCLSIALRETKTSGWLESLVLFVGVEAIFTFCIFSGLAVIWALFTPRWLESVVKHGFQKVVFVIAVVLAAAILSILYHTL